MKRQLAILIVLGLLIMIWPAAQPARAVSNTGLEYRCVSAAKIDVRQCAGDSCPALFAYDAHTLVPVTGQDNGWLQVKDPLTGVAGYIPAGAAASCTVQSWQTKPVIPAVTERVRQMYLRGLERGNNPKAFSKVGDCQSVVQFFMALYDTPGEYDLGPYTDLQRTIDHFAGSFKRFSEAVDNGYNVASVLSHVWADKYVCEAKETPLACEARLHNPSIVIISMETWWAGKKAEDYEKYLAKVVQYWVEREVVPILATKADNLEKDGSINAAIARVAEKYNVPLWNFWLAAQALPGHGMISDGFHLSFAQNQFGDAVRLRNGWPARNLTALQALDAVWRGVSQ
jgi:hypothetical protein